MAQADAVIEAEAGLMVRDAADAAIARGEGQATPVQTHPALVYPLAQPITAPSRIIEVVFEPVTVLPGGTITGRVDFQSLNGWLIGWRGTVFDVTGVADFALTQSLAALGVQFNGEENIVTTGTTLGFATFSTLFAAATSMTPIMRQMGQRDIADFFVRNDSGALNLELGVRLTLFFARDQDIQRAATFMAQGHR
jgi:hypothetical protein